MKARSYGLSLGFIASQRCSLGRSLGLAGTVTFTCDGGPCLDSSIIQRETNGSSLRGPYPIGQPGGPEILQSSRRSGRYHIRKIIMETKSIVDLG